MCLSLCLYLSVCLSVCVLSYLSLSLSVCLCLSLSVCLSVSAVDFERLRYSIGTWSELSKRIILTQNSIVDVKMSWHKLCSRPDFDHLLKPVPSLPSKRARTALKCFTRSILKAFLKFCFCPDFVQWVHTLIRNTDNCMKQRGWLFGYFEAESVVPESGENPKAVVPAADSTVN